MQFAKQLEQIELRFEELSSQLADPEIISDGDRYRKAAKHHSDLSELVARYREWKRVEDDLEQARPMLMESDPDLKQMAADEIARLEPVKLKIEEELRILLLPKDPNDEKNVVLEIRAGTGGDEATLFAAEIFRMYNRYAESQRWRIEVTSASESAAG
jgi:peptide chain release factor 1